MEDEDDLEAVFMWVLNVADQGEQYVDASMENHGYTPLHVATLTNDKPAIEKLLRQPCVDINARDNQGATSLLHAVLAHHTDIVALFLENGASLIPDNTGLSPWIAACMKGYADIVDLFLATPDFDVDRVDDGNMTGLFTASSRGHTEVVARILRHNPSLTIGAFLFRVTPLHSAAALDHTAVVKLLLKHPDAQSILDRPSIGGARPLHMACENDNLEIVRLLLQRGANPWARQNNGDRPYDKALDVGNPEMLCEIKQAMLEPCRFRILEICRFRESVVSSDSLVSAVIDYVTQSMLCEHFQELRDYMLPAWCRS